MTRCGQSGLRVWLRHAAGSDPQRRRRNGRAPRRDSDGRSGDGFQAASLLDRRRQLLDDRESRGADRCRYWVPRSRNVYFTSWLDEAIGYDTHLPTTSPARGDWGGIIYRVDIDESQLRPNLEDEGIFLNYVNYADIRYGGGGNVVIDSIQQVVNPIQIVGMRPTVTFNRISRTVLIPRCRPRPDSFEETNFHCAAVPEGGPVHFGLPAGRAGDPFQHDRQQLDQRPVHPHRDARRRFLRPLTVAGPLR